MSFDWHGGELSRDIPIGRDFRITQNVRRFISAETGIAKGQIKVPRSFHQWLKENDPQTLGDVIDEWRRQNSL